MKASIRNSLLGLVAIFLAISSEAQAQTYLLDAPKQLGYIRSLLTEKKYPLAEVEAERFLHLFPQHEEAPEVRCLLALALMKQGRHGEARKVLSRVIRDHGGDVMGQKALLLMGDVYYAEGRWAKAQQCYEGVRAGGIRGDLRDVALYRQGWIRLQRDNWQEASRLFAEVSPQSPLYDASQGLSARSLHGAELPAKDPTLAGVLAIVPGLGHAYVSRYKDAAVSFVLNGLFIWGAVEAFDEDQIALGAILTLFEAGWYAGNIYSAVNAAHKYNRAVRDRFRRSLGHSWDLGLLFVGGRPAGVNLTTTF